MNHLMRSMESPSLGQSPEGSVPHPSAETLVRFVEGTSRRLETRKVVRHLLRGCRACSVLIAGQVSLPVDADVYEPIFRRALKKRTEGSGAFREKGEEAIGLHAGSDRPKKGRGSAIDPNG